jgi:hypothetical protein
MKEECLPAKMGMSDVLWLISNFYDVQEQNFPSWNPRSCGPSDLVWAVFAFILLRI